MKQEQRNLPSVAACCTQVRIKIGAAVAYMGSIEPRSYTLRTGESIIVRSAQLEDVQALIEQTRAVMAEGIFMVTASEEFNVTREQGEAWVQSHISDEGKILLVAIVQEQLIGLLHFKSGGRRRLAPQGDFGMSVLKEWRERGVGRALVESLLAWGSANPLIKQIRLSVLAANEAAIRLYTTMGFVLEGRLMNQVKLDDGTYTDLILMARSVKSLYSSESPQDHG
jgi:RimJ/RimL family protein N-acetyltransferase